MSVRATVLYDAPGPNALRRNALYTVLTVILAIALIGWVLVALHSKGQLDAVKWAPFIDPRTWNTYLLPGLVGTLKSAFSSVILAIILGVLLGLGSSPDADRSAGYARR